MAEIKERRKTPRKTTAATPKPDSEKPAAPGTSNLRAQPSPEELRKQIEEAAYYRARQRGFAPGHELEDWVQAESEVLRGAGARPEA